MTRVADGGDLQNSSMRFWHFSVADRAVNQRRQTVSLTIHYSKTPLKFTVVVNHALRQEQRELMAKVINQTKQLYGFTHEGAFSNATGCPEFGAAVDGCCTCPWGP